MVSDRPGGRGQARELWIKLQSNRALGGYEIQRAVTDHGDPKWPDLTLTRSSRSRSGKGDRQCRAPGD